MGSDGASWVLYMNKNNCKLTSVLFLCNHFFFFSKIIYSDFRQYSYKPTKSSFQILGNEWKAWMAARDKPGKAKVSDSESDDEETEDNKLDLSKCNCYE